MDRTLSTSAMPVDRAAEILQGSEDEVDARLLDDVHAFWFGPLDGFMAFPEDRFPLWFGAAAETDRMIADRYGHLVETVGAGNIDMAALTPDQRVAAIVLLDQFTRNIHRGSAEAYRFDAKARELANTAIALGVEPFKLIERLFVLMPLGHSEALADQERMGALYDEHITLHIPDGHFFWEAGKRQVPLYHSIISRFGRFPHRNGLLGRESTPEEEAFLAETKMSPF